MTASLNGRELLTHAGTISHQIALEKSALEYSKYNEAQKQTQQDVNLRELEKDLKQLKSIRDVDDNGA